MAYIYLPYSAHSCTQLLIGTHVSFQPNMAWWIYMPIMAHLYTQLPIGMYVPFQPQFLLQGKNAHFVHFAECMYPFNQIWKRFLVEISFVLFLVQFLLQGKMQFLVHLCTQLNACTLSTKYGTEFWLKSALCYGEEMHHKSKRYQEKKRGGEGKNEKIYKQWYVHFGMWYHGVKAWSSMRRCKIH